MILKRKYHKVQGTNHKYRHSLPPTMMYDGRRNSSLQGLSTKTNLPPGAHFELPNEYEAVKNTWFSKLDWYDDEKWNQYGLYKKINHTVSKHGNEPGVVHANKQNITR